MGDGCAAGAGVAEGLDELRAVLEGVTEEEFGYDVDYIVDSLEWGEEGLVVDMGSNRRGGTGLRKTAAWRRDGRRAYRRSDVHSHRAPSTP